MALLRGIENKLSLSPDPYCAVLGGGKFSNGAVSGSFTHMFNHEMYQAQKTQAQMEQNGRKGLSIAHGKGDKGYYVTDNKGFKYMSDTPEMRQHLDSLKVGLMIPATIVETALVGNIPSLIGHGYSFYSGANFDTLPTSTAGWLGKGYDAYVRE